MEYYIKLKNITKRTNLLITNELDEEVGKIKFLTKKGQKNIKVTNLLTNQVYYIKSNPYKLKNRFIITKGDSEEAARIQVGYKIIHSILEKGEYYFVKSAFFQIKYRVYLNREVVTRLEVVKKNKERAYKITSIEDDFVNVIAVFLLARAVRIKALLS